MNTLAVIITVHNRINTTLVCLDRLYSQFSCFNNFDFCVYLTDDGSTDGTSDVIREKYPQVSILNGTGDLFWNKGMHLAFGEALKDDYDFYLWVNNDTTLFHDAIKRLLNVSKKFSNRAIIVGSTKDPDTGEHAYGGLKQNHPCKPIGFEKVIPEEFPIFVDTMNGNCVLIPKYVAKKVGNLDPHFSHGIGDFDYGLRAKNLGIPIILAPGYLGSCKRDHIEWKSPFDKLRNLLSIKVIPIREWMLYVRRHAGCLWPLYLFSPYIKAIFNVQKNTVHKE